MTLCRPGASCTLVLPPRLPVHGEASVPRPWHPPKLGSRSVPGDLAGALLGGFACRCAGLWRHRRRRLPAGRKSSLVSSLVRRCLGGADASPPLHRDSTEREPSGLEVGGVPLNPDFIAVGIVYFAQGALGLAALAKPFFLKDELHLAPAEASLLLSLTYWPWTLKPLWGFIADSLPIFGSRRRAYLVLAGLVSCAGFLALWFPMLAVGKEAVVFAMMLGNLGIAFSDVVVDGLVVEKARGNDRLMGNLQSYSWGCRGVGAVLSAYLSGALLESWGARAIFGGTALLPLLVAVAALLVDEQGVSQAVPAEAGIAKAGSDRATGAEGGEVGGSAFDDIFGQLRQLWDVLRSPQVWPPVLFIALWQSTPNAGSALFYFSTNELHFGPEFLGRAQLAASLASLAGIFLYNRVFASVSLRGYLLWVNLAAVAIGFLPLLLVSRANVWLGIPDQAFVLGGDVIQTVAGELAHMPILVLAAQLCPPGVEATFFALLMSVLNLSSLASTLVGAWLTDLLHITETDFTNLPWLVAICNISSLLPLALLGWVGDRSGSDSAVTASDSDT